MVAKASNDRLASGVAAAHHIRYAYVDVTESVNELCRRHLCGPASSMILAKALIGTVFLGKDLEQKGDAVSLTIRTNGPIGGVITEMTCEGRLRGYPNIKILADFDTEENLAAAESAILGGNADTQALYSAPGKILGRSQISYTQPTIETIISQHFRASNQVGSLLAMSVIPSRGGGVEIARGFLVEAMPDTDKLAWETVRKNFDDGHAALMLETARDPQQVAHSVCLAHLKSDEPRTLFFGCSCSRERAKNTLNTLSADELKAMAARPQTTDVFCHFCGECYSFEAAELLQIAEKKSQE